MARLEAQDHFRLKSLYVKLFRQDSERFALSCLEGSLGSSERGLCDAPAADPSTVGLKMGGSCFLCASSTFGRACGSLSDISERYNSVGRRWRW